MDTVNVVYSDPDLMYVPHCCLPQNGEQSKSLSLELELTDESSATQFKYTKTGADEFSMSFMQCVLPNFTLGGTVQSVLVVVVIYASSWRVCGVHVPLLPPLQSALALQSYQR